MNLHMHFRLAPRSMTSDDLELLQVLIFLEFRVISLILEATTATWMKRYVCTPRPPGISPSTLLYFPELNSVKKNHPRQVRRQWTSRQDWLVREINIKSGNRYLVVAQRPSSIVRVSTFIIIPRSSTLRDNRARGRCVSSLYLQWRRHLSLHW